MQKDRKEYRIANSNDRMALTDSEAEEVRGRGLEIIEEVGESACNVSKKIIPRWMQAASLRKPQISKRDQELAELAERCPSW